MTGTVVGAVDVEVRVALEQLDASLGTARAKTEQFDRQATAAFKEVEKASGQMGAAVASDLKKVENSTAGVTSAQDALLATWRQSGKATADQIRAVGGLDAANKILADDLRKTRQAEQELAAATAKTTQELKKTEVAAESTAKALDEVKGGSSRTAQGVNQLAGSVGRMGADMVRGISPMTSLGQEAGSLAGGLGNIARGAGAAGVGVGVVGGIIAAAAVGFVVASKAAYDYDTAQKQVELTLYGLGRATGASADDLMALAERSAQAGEISVKAAREQEAAFIRMGVTNTGVLEGLIAVSKDYALVTGQEQASAVKELGAAFADPISGVATLNEKLNLLGEAETQHIIRLARQGDLTGAQAALLKAMSSEVQTASEKVNVLAGAWDKAANAVSNYWNAFGKGVKDLFTEDTLEERQQKLQRWSGFGYNPELERVNAELAAQRARAAQQAQDAANRELSRQAGDAARALNPTDEQRNQINDRIAVVNRARAAGLMDEATATRALASARRQLAALDRRDAGPRDPNAARAESLRKEAEAMEANAAGALDLANAYLTNSGAALKAEATRQALTRAARSGADAEAQIRRQLALNLGEMAAQGAKNAAQLQDQANAQRGANEQVAAGVLTSKEAADAMRDDAVLRPLLAAEALAEGKAKETLRAVIEALTKAQREWNEESARSQALSAIERQNEENRVLERQLQLLGATNRERSVALAQLQAEQQLKTMGVDPASQEGRDFIAGRVKNANLGADLDSATFIQQTTEALKEQQDAWKITAATYGMTREAASAYRKEHELLNDATRRGIDLTDDQRAAIHDLAGDYAEAEEAARRLQEQQQAAADAADFFGQTAYDALEGIIDGSKSAEDALKAVVLAISKAVLQATLLGQGPLAGLFGTQNPNGGNGGFLGSIFNSLFGANGSAGGGGDFLSQIFGGGGGTPTFGGGSAGNSDGVLSFANAMIAHRGATVGSATMHRQVPMTTFLKAPRLHDGLGPDEFPAILERGEKVTSKRDVRRGGGSGPLIGQVVIQTTDLPSFNKSERQVAGQLGRAMLRATRRQS